jgi:tetratricopeptide (TPR) repeat protein
MPEDQSRSLNRIEELKEALKKAVGKERAGIFIEMGNQYVLMDKFTKAEVCFTQAREAGGDSLTLLNKYSELLNKTGRSKMALELLEEAKERAKDPKDKALITMWEAHAYWRTGNYDEGRKGGEISSKILEGIKDRDEELEVSLADSYNVSGLCLWEMSRNYEALKKFNKALEIFEGLKDLKKVAMVKVNVGLVNYQVGNFEEALAAYTEGIEAEKKAGGAFSTASIMNNIGLIRLVQGDLDDAEDQFQKANKIAASIGYRFGIHLAELNLMDLNVQRGDMIKAKRWGDRALKGFLDLGEEVRVAWVKCGLAQIAIESGHPDDATNYAKQALTVAEKFKSRETEAIAQRILGLAALARKDLSGAEQRLKRSLEIFKAIDFAFETGRALVEMAILHKAKDDMSDAERFAKEAREVLTRIGAKLELERLEAALGRPPS